MTNRDRNLPSNWGNIRQRALRRDDSECKNCGRKGGDYGDADLHVHHIVPRAKGGSNSLGNLRTLCKDCHNAIHHNDKLAPTAQKENTNSESSSSNAGPHIRTNSGKIVNAGTGSSTNSMGPAKAAAIETFGVTILLFAIGIYNPENLVLVLIGIVVSFSTLFKLEAIDSSANGEQQPRYIRFRGAGAMVVLYSPLFFVFDAMFLDYSGLWALASVLCFILMYKVERISEIVTYNLEL